MKAEAVHGPVLHPAGHVQLGPHPASQDRQALLDNLGYELMNKEDASFFFFPSELLSVRYGSVITTRDTSFLHKITLT